MERFLAFDLVSATTTQLGPYIIGDLYKRFDKPAS
jgi:hypothetical protein